MVGSPDLENSYYWNMDEYQTEIKYNSIVRKFLNILLNTRYALLISFQKNTALFVIWHNITKLFWIKQAKLVQTEIYHPFENPKNKMVSRRFFIMVLNNEKSEQED